MDQLLAAYEAKAIFPDGTAGWHDCEICPGPEAWYSGGEVGPVIRWRGREVRLYGHGHYLLQNGVISYMAPALLLHYILDHGYQPPQVFLEATSIGVFLRPGDLLWEPYSREEDVSAG